MSFTRGIGIRVFGPQGSLAKSAIRFLVRASAVKLSAAVLGGLVIAVGLSTFDAWGPARLTSCLVGALVWVGGELVTHRLEMDWKFERPGKVQRGWSSQILVARLVALATAIVTIILVLLETQESRSWLGPLWPYSLFLRTLVLVAAAYAFLALVQHRSFSGWINALSIAMILGGILVLFFVPESEFPSEWGISQILTAVPIAALILGADWLTRRTYTSRIGHSG